MERWTSWTLLNPRRRFIGYLNYRDELKDCKYFQWVDHPLSNQWYVNILLKFHNNVNLNNHAIFWDFKQQKVMGNPGLFRDFVKQPMEGVGIQH